MPLLERNKKQAEVPDCCEVLMNERGTAPGMLFRKDLHPLKGENSNASASRTPSPVDRGATKALIFSLPGVPWEMKALLTEKVIPLIKKEFKLPFIIHQTLLTVGVGESMIADKIKEWEEKLPSHMKLAYLPHFGMVRLRITSKGNERNELEKEMEEKFTQLKEQVKEWMVIDEDITLQQAVARSLKSRKETCGTAESCTGGYIAHLLSRDPGSSSNFKGSIVSYDNQVKIDLLGVKKETLDNTGAVSEETIRQMAAGALKELRTDYVIATSGIMGPDGGSEKKPVGMVWIAVGNKDKVIAKEFQFRFDRTRNIEQTAIAALYMLWKIN